MIGDRRNGLAAAGAALLPLAAALALVWAAMTQRLPTPRLVPVTIGSASGLERVFGAYRYTWPPTAPLPPLALTRLPGDLAELPPARRKRLFLQALLPLVVAADEQIRAERRILVAAFAQDGGTAVSVPVRNLARKYRVFAPLVTSAARARLLRRCDTVPPGLVLAQAAKESGWGTSAFAVAANNLFGMWTWDPNSGLVPSARPRDARHLVRTYPDLAASVRDYLYNLNVGHAYLAFRRLRARERVHGRPLDALALAGTLHRYSQRRATYVTRLRDLMLQNGLQALPRLRLATVPIPAGGGPQDSNARDRSQ